MGKIQLIIFEIRIPISPLNWSHIFKHLSQIYYLEIAAVKIDISINRNQSGQSIGQPPRILDDLVKLQYQEASQVYRGMMEQMLKLIVVYVTVISTLMGLSAVYCLPSLLGLAGIVLMILICSILGIYKISIPIMYIGYATEKIYMNEPNSSMVSLYLKTNLPNNISKHFDAVFSAKSELEKVELLRKCPRPMIGASPKIALVTAAILSLSSILISIFPAHLGFPSLVHKFMSTNENHTFPDHANSQKNSE